MNLTQIEWTHRSANALKLELPDGSRINACVHKSRGCTNCYAESNVRRFWKKRWGKFPGYTAALLKLGRPVLVKDELRAVLRLSDRIAAGKADPKQNMIFWHDMTDEYLDFWPFEMLDGVWVVRALTPNLIHQVLTKRPERMVEYLRTSRTQNLAKAALAFHRAGLTRVQASEQLWPLPNVWLGVSAEDQPTADERIPHLLRCPAAVRFISAEPLLALINIDPKWFPPDFVSDFYGHDAPIHGIHWVIVGGESGHGARPCATEWVNSIVKQCAAAGFACFVKQLGANPVRIGDLKFHPMKLRDSNGGDPSEWPDDLRVRQMPRGEAVTS